MKIKTREEKNRMKIFVIDYDLPSINNIDSESWEFFESVSIDLIKEFSGNIVKKNDGPDSSRWIYSFDSIIVFFDFDDMIGMNVSLDLNDREADKLFTAMCSYLSKKEFS